MTGVFPVTFANTIRIYPNPAKNKITILTDDNSLGYEIKIINSLSQTVFQTIISQTQYSMDLTSCTGKGTYFVQLYNDDGKLLEVRKIILQ